VKAPVGVSLMPLENRREAIVRLATGAERRGYAGFFLPETWAHDVTVLLAEAALRTERIGLGTGILSVWGRSPGTLAMAAATLHDVSGGRFALGLGASTAQLVEGLHDTPYRAPLDRLRRIVVQVRALLAGERLPLVPAGARPLRLNVPPAPGVPVHLAGLAPQTIRLAGEVADGWLPFLFPRSRLLEGVALLREGAARATPARPLPKILPSLPTVVAADAAAARRGAAWFVAFYLTSMGPFYPRTISRLGFAKEVEAVIAANPTRGSAVVPPDAEVLLDELTVYGTPEEARARLAAWHEAGAAMPVLLLPPNQTAAQIDFALDALC
jgi:alkanesulfonate monooxygenase SsuD/methylene tetrahydromethanopterin reductase-like flavin-dependent oxidoreductase (luciferase family)